MPLLEDVLLLVLLPVFAAEMVMGVVDVPELPLADDITGALVELELTPPDAPEGAPATPPTTIETGGLRSSSLSKASWPRKMVFRGGRFQPRSHWLRRKDERFHAIADTCG